MTTNDLTAVVVTMAVNGGTVTVGRRGEEYVVLMHVGESQVERATKVVATYKDAAFHALMHCEWLASL